MVGDRKVTLASGCNGGIIFANSDSVDPIRKIAFKVVESPEGGAITLGVANPEALKDRNF